MNQVYLVCRRSTKDPGALFVSIVAFDTPEAAARHIVSEIDMPPAKDDKDGRALRMCIVDAYRALMSGSDVSDSSDNMWLIRSVGVSKAEGGDKR